MKGSVRKRGANWYIIFDLGRDETGKRRQKWQRVAGTKRDAERELSRLLSEASFGGYIEPSKTTVADYLRRWLSEYAAAGVGPRTLHRYREIIERHLIPALGARSLEGLRPLHIQHYYRQALESGRLRSKAGLSSLTVLHHHRVLRSALAQAVKWQLLPRNPADSVDPPRARRSEMATLDPEHIRGLLNGLRGRPLYIPVLLAVSTGMRLGEILGLTWEDIDMERALLVVRRAASSSNNRADTPVIMKGPKSGRARVLTLPEIVVFELRAHKGSQESDFRLLGIRWERSVLVVADADGSVIRPHLLSKRFAYYITRAGLPHIRFHDLRHSHATALLVAGVHPKIVSERLGHSSIQITLDTYTHVLPGMQEDAARQFNRFLESKPE